MVMVFDAKGPNLEMIIIRLTKPTGLQCQMS